MLRNEAPYSWILVNDKISNDTSDFDDKNY
jgi:hypothetical protein